MKPLTIWPLIGSMTASSAGAAVRVPHCQDGESDAFNMLTLNYCDTRRDQTRVISRVPRWASLKDGHSGLATSLGQW